MTGGPVGGVGVPGAGGYVRQVGVPGAGAALQPVEGGDQHGPVHDGAGGEPSAAGAMEQLPAGGVLDAAVKPAVRRHIREGLGVVHQFNLGGAVQPEDQTALRSHRFGQQGGGAVGLTDQGDRARRGGAGNADHHGAGALGEGVWLWKLSGLTAMEGSTGRMSLLRLLSSAIKPPPSRA